MVRIHETSGEERIADLSPWLCPGRPGRQHDHVDIAKTFNRMAFAFMRILLLID
jgi:hypothetical protein